MKKILQNFNFQLILEMVMFYTLKKPKFNAINEIRRLKL